MSEPQQDGGTRGAAVEEGSLGYGEREASGGATSMQVNESEGGSAGSYSLGNDYQKSTGGGSWGNDDWSKWKGSSEGNSSSKGSAGGWNGGRDSWWGQSRGGGWGEQSSGRSNRGYGRNNDWGSGGGGGGGYRWSNYKRPRDYDYNHQNKRRKGKGGWGSGKGWGERQPDYDENKPLPHYFPDRNMLKTDIIKHLYEFPRAENPDRDFMRNLPHSAEPCEKCKMENKQCICDTANTLGATSHPRNAGIPDTVKEAKRKLNETKCQLDGLDLESWKPHTRSTLVTSFVVREVRNYSQAELCTNAWCKMMEMLEAMPLVPKEVCKSEEEGGDGGVDGNIRTMHLCECPGGFISATNHHLRTKHPRMKNWQWMAITLNPYFEGNSLTAMIDDDAFYRETYLKWSTGVDDSGNIMAYRNVRDLVERAQRKQQVCDIVTADGSVDSQFDANNQERITTRLHFSELVAALGLLRTGGSLVLKMFTLFEPSSKAIIWLVRAMFDRCIVCKPEMSKPGNSEVYVVGLGFGFIRSAVLNRLMALMEDDALWAGFEAGDDELLERAIVPDAWMSEDFTKAFAKCSAYFSTQQTDYIERNLRLFKEFPFEEKQLINARKRSYPTAFIERLDLRRLKEEDKIVPDPAIPLNQGGNINSTRSLPTAGKANKSGTQSSRAEFRRLYEQTQGRRADLAKEKPHAGFVPTEGGSTVMKGARAEEDEEKVPAIGSNLSKALLEKAGLTGEGLKHGNPIVEVENRRPTDRRGLGHGSVGESSGGPMVMHAKPAMKMRRELENTLLGKISSGDYLKESWFTECGVPLEPYEVKLSKFADSDALDKVVYYRTEAAWEQQSGRVEVPKPAEDESALEEIRKVAGFVEVPLGERVLEINPASPTESVIECERIIRCELGTSSSSKLPDRHKDVVALLPPEATSEPLDSIFVRISRDSACPYPIELTEYELRHRREWLGPIMAALNCHPHRALIIGLPQSTLLTRWSAGILQILALAFYHTQLVTPTNPVTGGAWIICTHRGYEENIRDSVPYRACRQFLQCLYDASTMTEARGGFIPNVLPPPYFTEESFARYICDFNTEVLTTEYEGVWRAMERPALERSEVQQEKEEKEEEKKDATV